MLGGGRNELLDKSVRELTPLTASRKKAEMIYRGGMWRDHSIINEVIGSGRNKS
jgi:hypothetical protein